MDATATIADRAGTAPARSHASATAARRAALAILLVATLTGAALRFYRLGVDELSRGEAAAWSAAAAPDLRSVFRASERLDPGKSGVYDLMLHLWIAAFGDEVAPMRALSAIFGTLSILLIFAATREIFITLGGDSPPELAAAAGAFAALLYACNLQMITIDRTARMYPLMLAAVFAQLFCFARTHRRGAVASVVGAALAADLAVAANFTALFLFTAQALWLVWLWFSSGGNEDRTAHASGLSIGRPAAALALAALIFLPFALIDAPIAVRVLHAGVLGSITPRPAWWPLRAAQVMTGNAAFWPMLGLAIFGIWRAWRAGRAIRFILCWALVPFAILEFVSYAITPMMVERYVLASLAAYLVLAAVGLACLPAGPMRYLAAALVVAQSLAHVHHHWRAPEDVQWREAARFAVAAAPAGQPIAVMPPEEPLLVLRYYLAPSARARVVGADARLDARRNWQMRCGAEPLLIGSTELPQASLQQVEACYPRLLARFRLVEVRGR